MGFTFGSVLHESSFADGTRIVALRYGAGAVLPPHRHEIPYISALVHGQYTEVRGVNPRRCELGTVILHDAWEEHADFFRAEAICVNVYPRERAAGLDDAICARLATSRPRHWAEAFDVIAGVQTHDLHVAARRLKTRPPWLQHVLRHFAWTGRASLREAATCAGVHPAHFARAFRAYMGSTPSSYRRRERIAAASKLLLTTSESLACISADVGFYDQSDFANQFLEASGLPPGRFRSVFRR